MSNERVNGHDTTKGEKKLGADVEVLHRNGDSVTLISVRWTPNGFYLQMRPVQDRTNINPLEGQQLITARVPFIVRQKREPLE